MPKRIYSLAKELKVDSKQLVDICAKCGITDKGSALASLTDEEVAKVQQFISGGSGKSSPDKPERLERPAKVATSKPKEIPVKSTSSASSSASTKKPKTSLSKGPLAARGAGPLANRGTAQPSQPVAAAPKPEEPKPQEPETITRDNAYRGRGNGGKIKVIGTPRPKKDEGKGDTSSPAENEGPVGPKLAPLPQAAQPKPAVQKANEPTAQKPTIRLPKDAIQKAKEGSSGRLDQIREQAERKRGKSDKQKDGETENTGRGRGRGGRRAQMIDGSETAGKKKGGGLAGMADSRQRRQAARKRRGGMDDDRPRRPRRRQRSGPVQNTAAERKENVAVELPCTVREFSEAAGVPAATILRKLMEFGTMVTINAVIDFETAETLQIELELPIELKQAVSLEDAVITSIEDLEDAEEDLETRPPVITFLGHVDHGKTSLLDHIINLDVVSGEAGGITQHIRAYTVKKGDKRISFVDTPGHEAFTEMRARGANVTDIAVLVVAADDGIMPQTEEAISHAKAAGVPIVVAMNKIDLPGANPDHVLTQLSQHELLPAEWGGDVEVVKTSAITGEGMDTLLETLLLTAEIHEYKANPNRPAVGICLEAEQEPGRGVVAKMMVKNGTLNVGDIVVCGAAHGRVKAMYDTLKVKKKVKQAGPSIPVNITGLDIAPEAGDTLYVLDDIAKAREIAAQRAHEKKQQSLSGVEIKVDYETFLERLESGTLGGGDEPAVLNLIIRADVRGSIEAIEKELAKLDHPEVKVKILQASVGGITVGDVTLADASPSGAVIIGFNVIPDEPARALADERGVEIKRYDIIYRVTSDIKGLLEGKLPPEEEVKDLGRALVKQLFSISRLGTIAGCHVLDGVIQRGCRIRVNREGRGIGDYPLDSLRRIKDDAKEVRKGYECGIKLSGFNDLKEGDILEAYEIEQKKREL